jgi:DNA-binding response OmpR family regulator
MNHNQIEVFFVSKKPQLLEAFSSLFYDEADFSCKGLSSLDEVSDFLKIEQNRILLVDVGNDFYHQNLIFDQKNSAFLSLPTIFMLDSVQPAEVFKKRGFSCFDIIVKPIIVNELLSKIRTLLAKKLRSNDLPISIRSHWFSPKKNLFQNLQGQSIKLTEKETKIISFLYDGRGEVRSKDQLLRAIWGYDKTISTHTLETHIYRLRKKLEIMLDEKDLILKISEGYFLNLS